MKSCIGCIWNITCVLHSKDVHPVGLTYLFQEDNSVGQFRSSFITLPFRVVMHLAVTTLHVGEYGSAERIMKFIQAIHAILRITIYGALCVSQSFPIMQGSGGALTALCWYA